MSKKNDKRLCWNCDGSVSLHLNQCPYCGVDLSRPVEQEEENPFKNFSSPFQSPFSSESIPKPPYGNAYNQDLSVSEEEWKNALGDEAESSQSEEDEVDATTKREMIALLLLLPGVVFLLFGLALILFSSEGVMTLKWNQNFAYFYFLGAVPLLLLGWRALR